MNVDHIHLDMLWLVWYMPDCTKIPQIHHHNCGIPVDRNDMKGKWTFFQNGTFFVSLRIGYIFQNPPSRIPQNTGKIHSTLNALALAFHTHWAILGQCINAWGCTRLYNHSDTPVKLFCWMWCNSLTSVIYWLAYPSHIRQAALKTGNIFWLAYIVHFVTMSLWDS